MVIWRLECHDELPSTSDLCKDRAEDGASAGLAIFARRQTAGRGTRGREWVDSGGNLALSFLLRPDRAEPLVRALPFLSAVAVFDAVRPFADDRQTLQIKWPNDLTLGGAKLSGTLIETGGGAAPWIVVGIGVNILSSPAIPGRQVTCLRREGGPAPAPDVLAGIILEQMSRVLTLFEAQGFGKIREEWLLRAHPRGTPLAVSSGGQYISGSFDGLDGDGTLLLRADSGKELRIVTGDVLLTG